MKRNKSLFVGVFFLLVTGGCSHDFPADENSAYYWRTDWRLDSVERAFLKTYQINKVYCRYFDVVMADTMPMPNATITFSEKVPQGLEIVPTVYITEDCMHNSHDHLAQRIVNRIVQISQTNDVGSVREIQIDCDYTARSRKVYYDFLSEVRKAADDRGLHLSTTIRLHQLSMPVPPVDNGVLMLYNTGDPRRFEERNPVLDLRDVQPYLRHLAGYACHWPRPIPYSAGNAPSMASILSTR